MNENTKAPTDGQEHLNGIDIAQVRLAQEEMRRDPQGDVSRPLHQAEIVWQDGYRTRTSVSGGAIIQGDEPTVYGGQGAGATPQDLLLTAVGHCLTATYIGGLTAAGVAVRSLKVSVSGRVNFRAAYGVDKGPSGFESIEVSVDVDADATPERIDALLARLLPTAPIPDTIMRPVPLSVKLHHSKSGDGDSQ